MKSTHWFLLLATLLVASGCADIVGADFDGFHLKHGDAGTGGATSSTGGSSSGGADASAGGGAGGGGGGTGAGGSGATSSGGATQDGSAGTGGDVGVDASVDASMPDATVDASDSGAEPVDPSAVGRVGDACTPIGAYACAGHAQKGQLICIGGTWSPNGTCSGANNCDTTPGSNAGSCQPIVAACQGKAAGEVFCQGLSRIECGKDLVSTIRLDTCQYVCAAGSCGGSCEPDTRGCDGFTPQTCDASGAWVNGATCSGVCSGGACSGTCTQGKKECNGQMVQTCDGRGTWQPGAACAASACVNGVCQGVCTPRGTQCTGNGVQVCDDVGGWGVTTACTNQACVDGACTGVCEPGARQCSGNGVQVCAANGQWSAPSVCAGQACVDGLCKGVCTPDTKQCSGLVPQTCDANGAWVSGSACTNVCSGGGCSGSCSPGTKECNGQVPQTCDGTGTWVPGTACTNQACSGGSCKGVCEPGKTQCNGNAVEVCDDSGAWGTATACVSSACQSGACTGVCEPGKTQCSGNGVQTCLSSGQWGAAVACTNQACSGGSCVGSCAPGAKQCVGLVPQTCDATGTWVSGTACTNVCSGGACSGTCSPTSKQCAGQVPQTCDATGTWVSSPSCANQACSGGNCVGVCAPGATQCSGNGVQTCDVNGQWSAAIACVSSACVAPGTCAGVCEPGTKQCSGNGVQTCLSTGQWGPAAACNNQACSAGACIGVCTPGAQRCSATGVETCNASGQWASSATCAPSSTCSAATTSCVACAGGTLDCDGSYANGCEKATRTKSSCGTTCSTVACGATQYCAAGSCTNCGAGTADCNGLGTDGCEVSLGTPSNCLTCGNDCGNFACSPTGCKTSCAADSDCRPSYGCQAGSCVSLVSSVSLSPSKFGYIQEDQNSGFLTCGSPTYTSQGVNAGYQVGSMNAAPSYCSGADLSYRAYFIFDLSAVANVTVTQTDLSVVNGGGAGTYPKTVTFYKYSGTLPANDPTAAVNGTTWNAMTATAYVAAPNVTGAGAPSPVAATLGATANTDVNAAAGTTNKFTVAAAYSGEDTAGQTALTGARVPSDAQLTLTYTCKAGFSDCDGNVANGCEATGGGCVPAPSCLGIGANCGPSANESCCTSPLVTGGMYNRSNDAAYVATVSDFRLDTYEITVGRFRGFVAAYSQNLIPAGAGKNMNNASDAGWDTAWNASLPATPTALTTALKCAAPYQTWTDSIGANENLPINCISWYEALAFCIWDGGRLPTEAEWNYAAAGGSDQRVYPWSNPPSSTTIDDTDAVYCGGSCTAIQAVGSKPAGRGRWGQADLAGNLYEWNLDAFGTYAASCNDCAYLPASAGARITRGGGFNWDAAQQTTSIRSSDDPARHYWGYGARCARNAP